MGPHNLQIINLQFTKLLNYKNYFQDLQGKEKTQRQKKIIFTNGAQHAAS